MAKVRQKSEIAVQMILLTYTSGRLRGLCLDCNLSSGEIGGVWWGGDCSQCNTGVRPLWRRPHPRLCLNHMLASARPVRFALAHASMRRILCLDRQVILWRPMRNFWPLPERASLQDWADSRSSGPLKFSQAFQHRFFERAHIWTQRGSKKLQARKSRAKERGKKVSCLCRFTKFEARVYTYDGCGHWMHINYQGETLEEVYHK